MLATLDLFDPIVDNHRWLIRPVTADEISYTAQYVNHVSVLFEAFAIRGYLQDGIDQMSLQYFKTKMLQSSKTENPPSQTPSNIDSLFLLDILHPFPGKPQIDMSNLQTEAALISL